MGGEAAVQPGADRVNLRRFVNVSVLALLLASPLRAEEPEIDRAISAGNVATTGGDHAEAQKQFARALDLLPLGPAQYRRRSEVALALAQAHLAANSPNAVPDLLTREWSAIALGGEAEHLDRAHYLLMSAALTLGDFKTAAKHSGLLADRYAKRVGEEHQGTVDARLNQGTALINAGEGENGMAVLDRALAAIKRLGGESLYQERLNMIAGALQESGQQDAAGVYFERLIASLEAEPEGQRLGSSYFNLAILRKQQRRLDEAVRLHEKAIAVLSRVSGADSLDTITAVAGLGNTYTVLGRPASGLRFLKDAYERTRKVLGENNDETWINANNLANALRELERFDEAREIDEAAYAWRLKNLPAGSYATEVSAQNLGLDHLGLKSYQKARALFDWIHRSRVERYGADHALTQDAAKFLALAESYDPDAAPSARQLATENIAKMDRMTANIRAGQLDQAKQPEEALKYHRRSFEAAVAEAGEFDPTTLVMLRNVARAERHLDKAKAIATYLDLNRRTLAWARAEIAANAGTTRADDIRRVANGMIYDVARFALSDRAASDLLFRILLDWKGLGTIEQFFLRQLRDDPPDQATAELTKRIGALQIALRQPGADALKLEAELGLAEGRLAEKSDAFRRARAEYMVQPQDISSRLGDDEVLIDYLIVDTPLEEKPQGGGEKVRIAMTPQAGDRTSRAMTPMTEVETGEADRHVYALMMGSGDRRVVAYLAPLSEAVSLLNRPNFASREETRAKLHDLLLKPLFELPGLDAMRHAYIVPDGELFLVPFEGLLANGTTPLADRLDVTLMRSASGVLKRQAVDKAKGGVLVVGDPDYGASPSGAFQFAALPKAYEEAKAIGAMAKEAGFTPHLLARGAASEDATRAAASGNRIIHLATHGFFLAAAEAPSLDAPWRGGIALAKAGAAELTGVPADDGIAYAAELASWPLEGTELVVLSACQTASGDRSYVDGLRGIPAALAIAGVERSLLALWAVPDEGASAFMQAFYDHLWRGGMSYEDAFRKTKADARQGRIAGAESADVWQAFVLLRN
jgi:CHAT domain-containing protein